MLTLFVTFMVPIPSSATVISPSTLLQPTQIQNVTYSYQDAVIKVDLKKFITIDGSIKPPLGTDITSGTILVDEGMKTSYFVLGKNPDGTLLVRRPTMIEVFKNFSIPEQTLKFNDANIIDLQPNIKAARAAKTSINGILIEKISQPNTSTNTEGQGKQQLYSLTADQKKKEVEKALAGGVSYSFDKTPLNGFYFDGLQLKNINIRLSGKIGLNMDFVTKYTISNGYDFGIKGAEVLGLKAALDFKAKTEVYVPIIGINLPFAVGNLRAGVFVVVGINGDIKVVVSGEEGLSFNAGIKGDTDYCIPTSFDTYGSHTSYTSAEFDANGQIEAGVYLTPSITLEALDMDVVKAEVRLGFKAYATLTDTLLDYGVNGVGIFHIAVLGEGFDIFNEEVAIFNRKKESPKAGYYIYGDLCAYRDDTAGAIFKVKTNSDTLPEDADPFLDKLPYSGKVNIYYYKANNTTQPYKVITTETSEDGILYYNFKAESNIDVVKGDSIIIQVAGVDQAKTKNVFSTIPFNGIRLNRADFFNEVAIGEVMPASGIRNLPGLNKEIISSEFGTDMLYYSGKNVTVVLRDSKNKAYKLTLGAVTDEKGKFTTTTGDIRPFNDAVPYALIDGFELSGNALRTSNPIYFAMVTDYGSDYIGKIPVFDRNGKVSSVKTVNGYDPLIKEDSILSYEHISSDHFIAINKYGSKKISNNINYYRNSYYVKDFDFVLKLGKAAAAQGVDVDLRGLIMGRDKQLVYIDKATMAINESNNDKLDRDIFSTSEDSVKKNAIASSHDYHKVVVNNTAYLNYLSGSDITQDAEASSILTSPTNPTFVNPAPVINTTIAPSTASTMIKRVYPSAGAVINKDSTTDRLDPTQPKGVDLTLNLDLGKSNLEPGYATGIIYVDAKATMNVEGDIMTSIQTDPWIIKGDRSKTGASLEQILQMEIDKFIEEGTLYFKRYVINQNPYANTAKNTWKPAANTIKHELQIDFSKKTAKLDGISISFSGKSQVTSRKLYVSIGELAKMMGGSVNYNASTKKLTLNVTTRNIVLNTTARTAVLNGKTLSLSSAIISSGADTYVRTDTITQLFGGSISSDIKNKTVKVNYTGN